MLFLNNSTVRKPAITTCNKIKITAILYSKFNISINIIMKLLKWSILLFPILMSVTSTNVVEKPFKLPFKVNKSKTIIYTKDGNKISGYIMAVTDKDIKLVEKKKYVDESLFNNCKYCYSVKGGEIEKVKIKRGSKGLMTFFLFYLSSLLLFFISSRGDFDENLRLFLISIYLNFISGIVLGSILLFSLSYSTVAIQNWKNVEKLYEHSAQRSYNIKMSESNNKLMNYSIRTEKKRTLYYNNYRGKVKGYITEVTKDKITLATNKKKVRNPNYPKGNTISIPWSDFNYVK